MLSQEEREILIKTYEKTHDVKMIAAYITGSLFVWLWRTSR